jgi:two-component system response regulator YesN
MENKILYQKTIKIIRDNKSNLNLNGAFVAKQLKVNRMYLHRKLKAYCNKNAGELIQTIRIKAAEELLKKTNKKIIEIAKEVGFVDSSYFTKKFKIITGQSPSVYRKSKT